MPGAGLGLPGHGGNPYSNASRHCQDIDLKCEPENRSLASIDTWLRVGGMGLAAETCDIAKKMAYATVWGVR
jgi:hypothetical protein